MSNKSWGCCGIVFVMILLVSCVQTKPQSGNQSELRPYLSNNKATVDVSAEPSEATRLLDYFNKQYPNSSISDSTLVDIDNDGLNELIVALNTYSGANIIKEEEVRKNGFDFLYVGVVFPKGKNPKESVIVLGKTVEKGMYFSGSKLFKVEKIGSSIDQIKVKVTNQEGKNDYFTLKVLIGADGIKHFQ
ncbi:hypothetical protein [Desulfitobacterium sp.]|uniref:hypothetical protein n=1 Tax=Desulfitobacterium sp. TaxID=49981 RepID=UPI002B20D2C1|nr:hypothetical protein [Desulfitobacterium sp.]MEA4900542.1 hypothetical protein [Desulfitobacterium sp.]